MKITVQNNEVEVVKSNYPNGNVRLVLQPWSIEITRPHKEYRFDRAWLVEYKNLPSLTRILEREGVIKLEHIYDVTKNDESVQLVQYLL